MQLSLIKPEDINILVIGDLMLDIYNYGDAHRISPEAPVPVFHSREKKYYLGGAANTFTNLCNTGVNAYLFGVIGDDLNGSIILDKINNRFNNWDKRDYIIRRHNNPTIVKERIIARSQQIVRVDVEEIKDLNDFETEVVLENFSYLVKKLQGFDAIIISDYGKGMICHKLIKTLVSDPRYANTNIYIDPFPKNKMLYFGAYCITPNLKETEEIGNINYIVNGLKIKNVIRTEGEGGMTLFHNDETHHIDTEAQTVYDVSGAGDTVIAVLAATKAMGFTMLDAISLSNKAAGNVVSQMGTTAVDPEFIKNAIKEQANAGNYVKSS
jgi:rfaE bifunctional protein kinase chain/domain